VTWKPLPEEEGFRDPEKIGASLDRVARRLGAPTAHALNGLFSRWDELVGASIAAHARPVSLKGGHLRVEVDSSAWATQLKYMTTELVARCCEELGAGAVKQIDVRVARRG
jgi:predicted nucleic acid-binding Zn ribbon protein